MRSKRSGKDDDSDLPPPPPPPEFHHEFGHIPPPQNTDGEFKITQLGLYLRLDNSRHQHLSLYTL